MGCGSSSISVQTFRNPEENKNYQSQNVPSRQPSAIQKYTFNAGNLEHESGKEKVEEFKQSNAENHVEIAKRKEEKRSKFDHEKLEEEVVNSLGPVLCSLEMDGDRDKNARYTVDDIIEHNDRGGGEIDWFKYGKQIYSWKKMKPIVQERLNHLKDITPLYFSGRTPGGQFLYPIHVARHHGLTRKELAEVLEYCRVGISIDVPREQYLARMKQSVEFVLEADTDGTDYLLDYMDQLNRWLADYPMNKVYNDPPDTKLDPNKLAFPLPADMQSDPSVLREWIETEIAFDCNVPVEGAWPMKELLKNDWRDTHDLYANEIQEHHGNEATEPLDMAIDGDVAWVEIELDLFKNDKTTEHQETVWNKRAIRTNLIDPMWMKKRREELAEILKKRYEKRQKNTLLKTLPTLLIFSKNTGKSSKRCVRKSSIPLSERQEPVLKLSLKQTNIRISTDRPLKEHVVLITDW
ncbi:uncharacterized protein LOC123545308 [Mercenaria mercenaria]|uniref:uncharacterized protein LOC123545308 n=1 Tax=Mercenaria mercenaria TaxID=6596 RepID=UPI00234EC29B|nr:uncharacterized protein LOC123545308 [Mercenaria mercenaria]